MRSLSAAEAGKLKTIKAIAVSRVVGQNRLFMVAAWIQQITSGVNSVVGWVEASDADTHRARNRFHRRGSADGYRGACRERSRRAPPILHL